MNHLNSALDSPQKKRIFLFYFYINFLEHITCVLHESTQSRLEPVGRESEAHPAISISIIPSLDFERDHLPPMQGYKGRVPRSAESWNTAKPRPS